MFHLQPAKRKLITLSICIDFGASAVFRARVAFVILFFVSVFCSTRAVIE